MNARLQRAQDYVLHAYNELDHAAPPPRVHDCLRKALILLGEIDVVDESTGGHLEMTRERMVELLGNDAHLLEIPLPT
jgi:hypothetical protein